MKRLKDGFLWTLWGIKAFFILLYLSPKIAGVAASVLWSNYSPWGKFYKKK